MLTPPTTPIASTKRMNSSPASRAFRMPDKTVLCAAALLAVTTAMAGLLTWSRHQVQLDKPISPENWSISFRPPLGWPMLETAGPMSGPRSSFAFGEPRRGSFGRVLIVQRVGRALGDTPEDVAMSLVRLWGYEGIARWLSTPDVRIERSFFGPLEGVRVEDERAGLIVSTAILGEEAYGLVLRVPAGSPFGSADHQLVDRVLNSVSINP